MDNPGSEVTLKDFYIPNYILLPGLENKNSFQIPACPVVVFINSKSGGQLGGELLLTYRALLNENQVFDLKEKAPDLVLQQLYKSLGILKGSGDVLATQIEEKLRIIVAGGDGTASWLLGVVSDLKLARPPPIATVPLGTGNNLPFSFGWGKKNPGTDHGSVKSFLLQVKRANEMKIDSWHILMKMKVPQGRSFDPIAPLDLPPSLHEFHHVFPTDKLQMANRVLFEFKKGASNHTYMRIDGEPWKQPLPLDDSRVIIEISHSGKVSMLANPHCRSKSIHDRYAEEHTIDSVERKKVGAAYSFKFSVK